MKCFFKKLFVIEGNIGAGKSTLLSLLKKNISNITILQEPVNKWKNIAGDDLLAQFYLNPCRWGFTFELYSMYTLLYDVKNILFSSDSDIIIAERSIFSNRAFQIVSSKLNYFDDKEKKILTELYNYFKEDYPGLNGVIRLNTDVATCLRRINKRGRQEEMEITSNYLDELEKQFEKIEYDCPVIDVDGNYDLNNPQKMLDDIIKFINMN